MIEKKIMVKRLREMQRRSRERRKRNRNSTKQWKIQVNLI